MAFYLKALSCLLILQVIYAEILEPPQDGVYKNGVDNTATLSCKVRTPIVDDVFWISQQNGVIWSPSFGGNSAKYSFTSDTNTGQFAMTILQLNRNDTGVYLCQSIDIAKATITVADPPGQPTITVSSDLEENQDAKFVCRSTGAYPSPGFVWTIDGETIAPSSETISANGGLSTSELTLPLTYQHHNKTLQCSVTNILQEIQTKTQVLDVKFGPKVSLNVVGSNTPTVVRGKAFSISCDVISNPPYSSVSWKKSGQPVSGSSLTLDQPDGIVADTGYMCTVDNPQGQNSATLNIAVHYAPVVSIDQGESLTKTENQRMILTCKADGKPDEISYEWTKDNDDTITTTSPNLDISRVSREDAGVYTCTAYNTLLGELPASGNKSIEVIVNYAPDEPVVQLSPDNPKGVYEAGGKATFSCSLASGGEGNPVPEYAWFKEGKRLSTITKELIIDVTTYNHSGDYKCSATNIVGGKNSSSLSATFQDVPEFVTSTEQKINITKGAKNHFLKCEYRGIPQPKIKWYFNNNPIEQMNQYTVEESVTATPGEVYITTVSVVRFQGLDRDSVNENDTGMYTCRASSEAGDSPTERQFTVTVFFGPDFRGQPKVAAELGEEATMTCEIWSNPATSSIVFLKKQQEIVSDDSQTVSDVQVIENNKYYKRKRTVTFHAVNADDYAAYTCTAVSPLAELKQEITLQKPSRPDTPTNLSLIYKTWDSFTVRWFPGFDGGKPQSFVISVNGVEQEITKNTTWTFTRMYPQTDYTIKVEAKNSIDRSLSAAIIHVVTDSIAIPSPQVTYNEGDTTLTVTQNSTECCVIILGSVEPDAGSAVAMFNSECHIVNGQRTFKLSPPFFNYYMAKTCIVGRENDVCSSASLTDKVAIKDDTKYIIIGGVVGGVLLLILIAAIVSYVIVKRRRTHSKLSSKSISPPISSGHINQVMETDEVDAETPYAMYIPQRNNLSTTPQLSPTSNNPSHRESENLDYVYAAVQKKPSGSVKYLNTFNAQQPIVPPADGFEMPRLDSPRTESNSDNTEQDTLDDLPVFQGEHNLSLVLGGDPPNFRHLSNISESGYSTPDSRVKKVIYEVIV